MCIPIELDVPVLTIDHQEVGTAREIICPCPADDATGADGPAEAFPFATGDLWLRVERMGQDDLFVPFGEILETRPDGVTLRTNFDDTGRRHWEMPPPGTPLPVMA
jgi:hypothetical protein